jgi:hypothetical protein
MSRKNKGNTGGGELPNPEIAEQKKALPDVKTVGEGLTGVLLQTRKPSVLKQTRKPAVLKQSHKPSAFGTPRKK